MKEFTLSAPLPSNKLGQNSRGHWSSKAGETAKYRALICLLAKKALVGDKPMWEKANVRLIAHFPTLAFPDPINFYDRMKAAFDGLQDAGLLKDDKNLWPNGGEFHKDAANPRVVIVVTPE